MNSACAALLCVACPYLLIFPHYLTNARYPTKIMEHKICVLITSTNFVRKISHYTKNWVRYDLKGIWVVVWNNGYSCQILKKLVLPGQMFEKYSKTQFRVNPQSESRIVPCGRTVRHDDANSRLSQFCERP